jgi:2-dehydropantoate 2-reductase
VLIVGTGAVATLLAERFHRCGVSFQIFGTPSERLRTLDQRFGGCAVDCPTKVSQHDRWIVALKAGQNAEKVQVLGAAPRPETILVLQNGLNPENDWSGVASRVDRALSTYGVKTTGPGLIDGGDSGEMTVPQGSSFAAPLRRAGFCVREAPDMAPAIWRKLAVNASLNVVATLYDVTNGRVLEISQAWNQTRLVSSEVAEVARALGVEWGQRPAWEISREVAEATAGNVCSTLADFRSGRVSEYQAINGQILAAAERLGVEVPALKRLDKAFADLTAEVGRRAACA